MEEMISRRGFFRRLGQIASPAFDKASLEGEAAAGLQWPTECPFPGKLYWNSKEQIWKPAFGVNHLGQQLENYNDPASVLTIFEEAPRPWALWNFKSGTWSLPMGATDIARRTVIGRKLTQELFALHSPITANRRLLSDLKTRFPEIDPSNAHMMGRVSPSEYYPEEVLTVFYKNQLVPLELQKKYGIETFVKEKDPPVYILKCHWPSRRVFIKFMLMVESPSDSPNIPLPEAALASHWGVSFREDGQMDPVRDFYFYANNLDVIDYCTEMGLEYPEDLFDLGKDVQVFAVTYHFESQRVLKIKRYYVWWHT